MREPVSLRWKATSFNAALWGWSIVRILIIGAGQLGCQLATTLSREHYHVMVMDRDQQALSMTIT